MPKDTSKKNRDIQVWINAAPTSADPLDYDATVHHVAFRSILGGLVSQYRAGRFVGMIAESWSHSDDFRTWSFKIRHLSFSNGDRITPEIVVQSWTRMAYLMRQKKSWSSFFSNVIGMDRISGPTDRVDGFLVSAQSITVKLKNPDPKLLETISFGLFSVVHPQDYDARTGQWKDPKKIISAGPYVMESWTDTSLVIRLRDDVLNDLWNPKAPQVVTIVWSPELKSSSDVIVLGSDDQKNKGQYRFFGSAPSGIAYLRMYPWARQGSPWSKSEFRKKFRALFFKIMAAQGVRVPKSFFPIGMSGISEIHDEDIDFDRIVVEKPAHSREINYRVPPLVGPLFQVASIATKQTLNQLGFLATEKVMNVAQHRPNLEPNRASYEVELGLSGTNILLEDPRADILFMFRSGEGIRLPDINGEIAAELKKSSFSFQRINELLWQQCVIVPVGHFSMGLWVAPHMDMSWLNSLLPPTEFQWMGVLR